MGWWGWTMFAIVLVSSLRSCAETSPIPKFANSSGG